MKEKIKEIAKKYHLQIVYAFGSRAKEALDLVENRIKEFSLVQSDLDIGVKPERSLHGEEKVEIAILFEDLFNVSKVDSQK